MISSHCPGHITLIFSIHDSSLLPRGQGSRGVGLCVNHGVRVDLKSLGMVKPEDEGELSSGARIDTPPRYTQSPELHVNIWDLDGKEFHGSVDMYQDLVSELREMYLLNMHESFQLDVYLQLPVSQGFGMSASGLMATCSAFQNYTNKGRQEQYVRLAHRLERKYHGGLGDILGLHLGGVEIRTTPGSPGAGGNGESFTLDTDLLLVWDSETKRHTSTYIDNPKWKLSISKSGDECVDHLMKGEWDKSKWSQIIEQSTRFSRDSGMVSEKIRFDFLEKVNSKIRKLELDSKVHACLCMLGISAVILPKSLDNELSMEELVLLKEELTEQHLGSIISKIQS